MSVICPECGCASHDKWCSQYNSEEAKKKRLAKPAYIELTWEGLDNLLGRTENKKDYEGFEGRIKKALEAEFGCKISIEWMD